EEFFEGDVSWSENDLVQATARQPNARAWYVLDDEALAQRVRDRTVADLAAAAPTATDPSELPFKPPAGARIGVRVAPGITHTIGGLRIDERARVLHEDGTPIDGLFAAGADVGGISTGGYASGLAAALVFGRIAAESVIASTACRDTQGLGSCGSGGGAIFVPCSFPFSPSTSLPTAGGSPSSSRSS